MVSITANVNPAVAAAGVPARMPAPARRAGRAGSNILGATGLSRRALAAMFVRDGLFGRDSDLTPAEQAAVQAALPELAGLKRPAAVSSVTPRLRALADYVAALVQGRAAAGERSRLEASGMSSAAISEVATLVEDLLAVFQPQR